MNVEKLLEEILEQLKLLNKKLETVSSDVDDIARDTNEIRQK